MMDEKTKRYIFSTSHVSDTTPDFDPHATDSLRNLEPSRIQLKDNFSSGRPLGSYYLPPIPKITTSLQHRADAKRFRIFPPPSAKGKELEIQSKQQSDIVFGKRVPTNQLIEDFTPYAYFSTLKENLQKATLRTLDELSARPGEQRLQSGILSFRDSEGFCVGTDESFPLTDEDEYYGFEAVYKVQIFLRKIGK